MYEGNLARRGRRDGKPIVKLLEDGPVSLISISLVLLLGLLGSGLGCDTELACLDYLLSERYDQGTILGLGHFLDSLNFNAVGLKINMQNCREDLLFPISYASTLRRST
jgi:hypothetical protein